MGGDTNGSGLMIVATQSGSEPFNVCWSLLLRARTLVYKHSLSNAHFMRWFNKELAVFVLYELL